MRGKLSGQGSDVCPASELRKIAVPSAKQAPSGSSRLAHHSVGIGCRTSKSSNAGPHHHAGAGDLSFSGTARQGTYSSTARPNCTLAAGCTGPSGLRRVFLIAVDALFLLRDESRRGRAFAHDQQHGLFVLGAIPMHLHAEMGDETTGWHRNGAVFGIEFRPRAYPPGPLQHDNVPIVGMEVRMAE